MLKTLIDLDFSKSNIFYSHTPKDFIYNDHDWRFDLQKVLQLKKYDLVINGNSIWDGGRKMHDSSDKQQTTEREPDGKVRPHCIRKLSV